MLALNSMKTHPSLDTDLCLLLFLALQESFANMSILHSHELCALEAVV